MKPALHSSRFNTLTFGIAPPGGGGRMPGHWTALDPQTNDEVRRGRPASGTPFGVNGAYLRPSFRLREIVRRTLRLGLSLKT
jgi:hypothetical protein